MFDYKPKKEFISTYKGWRFPTYKGWSFSPAATSTGLFLLFFILLCSLSRSYTLTLWVFMWFKVKTPFECTLLSFIFTVYAVPHTEFDSKIPGTQRNCDRKRRSQCSCHSITPIITLLSRPWRGAALRGAGSLSSLFFYTVCLCMSVCVGVCVCEWLCVICRHFSSCINFALDEDNDVL